MGEKEPRKEPIHRGTLYYLHHPGTDGVHSGYGLTLYPDRSEHLVDLLMVDLPQRADPVWLRSVANTYGDCPLIPLTAVHASVQMLPVLALGAAYAAPYLGRMNDAGLDGLDEIAAMQQIITNLGGSTRLLVASIRSLSDLAALVRRGSNTFTLLPGLVEELLSNPQTLAAAADFEQKASSETSPLDKLE